MALQSQVNRLISPAVAGDKATPDQSIYTPINYVADASGVACGSFCWPGSVAGTVSGTTTGDAAPLGFVERVINAPNFAPLDDGTLIIPEGYPLTVAVKGDYWVEAAATVTAGTAVYVDKTNGKIYGSAATNNIAASGWTFKTAASTGEMVIISNW